MRIGLDRNKRVMKQEKLTAYLQEKFGEKIEPIATAAVEPNFLIKDKGDLHEFCKAIREDLKLEIDFLCSISAVDTAEKFEIVYSVASVAKKLRFDFKIVMEYDGAAFDSVIDVWPAANWYEREIWELYGIDVAGHPNLTRFLLPDEWDQGNPMRKDWDAPDFKRLPEL